MSNTNDIIDKINLRKKFRFFFNGMILKKSLTFLFFLLLALVFWGLQVYSQRLDIKLIIPIKYTNVADNILFEHELPTQVNIHLKDYGSVVLKYALNKRDSLEIDLSEIINESSAHRTLQGQTYEQLIKTKLLPSSEIISISPTLISYAYSKVATRKLPVLFDGLTNLSAGYQLNGDITLEPDSVTAYGTKVSLDTLRYAYTVKDTINEIKGSQNIMVLLDQPKGVEYRPKNIRLNIPVDQFTQKELKVPVTCINLPEDLRISFFPAEVTISFFVGLQRYNLIDSKDFKILVDYKDLRNTTKNSTSIRIIEAPDFVRTKLPEPSEVEFILEQKRTE